MTSEKSAPAILFVCLGNICRSPLAEAAFRARMSAAHHAWFVDSAGTSAAHSGEPPDRRAQAVAQRNGVGIGQYRARQVTAADFSRFTHILAMDAHNLETLRRLAPTHGTASVGLLLDWAPGLEGQSVADPYYGGDAGFIETWNQVDRAAEALLACLLATG